MNFDKILQRFVTRAEKIIFRVTLALLVLLFVVQALYLNEEFRPFLSVTDRLEGKPLSEDVRDVLGGRTEREGTPGTEHHVEAALVLELIPPPGNSPELYLLVNGRVKGRFGTEPFYVSVSAGDMLEVMGHVPGNEPAVIRVVEVKGNLKAPEAGYLIKSFGDRELLSWIVP